MAKGNFPRAFEHSTAAGNQHAAAKTGADFLGAETQYSHIAEGTRPPAVDGGTQRLRGIVDDDDIVRVTQLYNLFYIGRITEQMGHEDRRVLPVRAASTVSAVRFSSLPTSANTGVAPTAKIGATTVLQQKLGIITSSPWSKWQVRKASSNAKLPEPQRTASSMPRRSSSSERNATRSVPRIIWPETRQRNRFRCVSSFQNGTASGTRGKERRRKSFKGSRFKSSIVFGREV